MTNFPNLAFTLSLTIAGSAVIAGNLDVLSEAAPSAGLNFSEPYIGAAIAGSSISIISGGTNTIGFFDNVNCAAPEGPAAADGFPEGCTSLVSVMSGGLMIGWRDVYALSNDMSLRLEGELTFYGDQKYITGSFPGAPGPFAFFYRTAISDQTVIFGNIYLDKEINERFTLFASAGIGASTMTVETSDFVVEVVAQSVSTLAFNIGAGGSFEISPGIDLFAQYRYVNFGSADLPLTSVVGGVDAGNYTLASSASEIRAGVNIGF